MFALLGVVFFAGDELGNARGEELPARQSTNVSKT